MRFGLISLALAGAIALIGAGGSIAGSTPDTDGDGVFNLVDNCVHVPNAPAGGPGEPQLDFDGDGFGNQCDGDFNNSGGTVNTTDFNIFTPCNAMALAAGFPFPVTGSVAGIDCNNVDMDGSGTINTTDFNFLTPLLSIGVNGESGLPCAKYDINAPNMTGRNICEFDPTPND